MKLFTIALLFIAIFYSNSIFSQKAEREYYPSGKLFREGKIKNDRFVGLQKEYYENGVLKREDQYTEVGLWLGFKEYDEYENLLSSIYFEEAYKDYPIRNFSNIKWTNISEGVDIYKYNIVDSSYSAVDSSFVILNYICYFSSGKMLDNTYHRMCPYVTPLNYLVIGFQQGLKAMRKGEKALVRISPEKAFGKLAQGNVPANSTLIYLVDLIEIQ